MRRLFTTSEAYERGLTHSALRWGERTGRWRRIERSVYGIGPDDPTELDRQRARVLASGGVAAGALAGVLHKLDSVELDHRPMRRRALSPDRNTVKGGVPCVDARQTLIDLAAILDDDTWEQALESALRKRLTTIDQIADGAGPLIRRVLARRPEGAPATESLLETLAVQVARTVPGLGDPVRQHVVTWPDGTFVARVDLSWPDIGMFLELDGQHHKDQPVYDARRETAVVAATGWLPGRFTWHEIVHIPITSARRMGAIAQHARLGRAA